MQTQLYYYTGTGNSLWVTRMLAEALGEADVHSLARDGETDRDIQSNGLGLIFPVYIWGVPARVLRFAAMLPALQPQYVFAVAVNGGQVANTLGQLRNVLAAQGITLAAGWEITMPSNYIPWGGPGSQAEQQKRFKAASQKIKAIAEQITQQARLPVETGPLWQRILLSGLAHPLSSRHIPQMDGRFWVDEKCNQCGICEKVCPTANITLPEGKPVWQHHCEQCFACLQWCPQEAIQYGKNTPKYERYQHPEVTLQDLLRSRNQA